MEVNKINFFGKLLSDLRKFKVFYLKKMSRLEFIENNSFLELISLKP
jgi:hypothetical protein